ncbi:sulfite exporter TauE/SafE family protein [Thermococcus sp.]|uniref:sulfite exporter TauE/SafE family protein n=1 Tax=Thermococcus sp. TaxID=35749 RepID=UPI00261284FA|nr:sulfite exporter TauE/SafE family protein [Thermococcus sp.]
MKTMIGNVITGLLAGIALGAFGSGSGAIAVPLLILSGVDPMEAKGSVLTSEVVTSTAGGIVHKSRGNFKKELSTSLLFGIIGAFLGAYLAGYVPVKSSKIIIGIYEIFAGIVLLAVIPRNIIDVDHNRGYHYAIFIGLLAGFVKGFLGTGWGPVGVTLLIILGALPKKVVGSSLFARVLISGTAALTYLITGHVLFSVAAMLCLGGLLGVLIGARLVTFIGESQLRKIIGAFVLLLGVYVLYKALG